MYLQGVSFVSGHMDQPKNCVPIDFKNFAGIYGMESVDELAARFIDGVTLSVSPLEDGLNLVDDHESRNITFQRFEGNLAIFSNEYEFELDNMNRPIALQHGGTRWIYWGH